MQTKSMSKFEQIDISQKVMRQIHDRKVQMKPRWYFVLKRLLYLLAILLAFAASIYFVNLTIFKFRIYDPFGYIWFGALGFKAAMGSANWELVMAAVISISLFFGLFKSSKYWYKYSPVPVVASFLVLISIAAVAFDKTGINDKVRAQGKYPALYAGEYADEYWVMGKVVGITNTNGMYVLTPDSEMVFVAWDETTKLPNGAVFKVNDTVQVVGRLRGAVFYAQGITIR